MWGRVPFRSSESVMPAVCSRAHAPRTCASVCKSMYPWTASTVSPVPACKGDDFFGNCAHATPVANPNRQRRRVIENMLDVIGRAVSILGRFTIVIVI